MKTILVLGGVVGSLLMGMLTPVKIDLSHKPTQIAYQKVVPQKPKDLRPTRRANFGTQGNLLSYYA